MSAYDDRTRDFADRHPGYSVVATLRSRAEWVGSGKGITLYDGEVYHESEQAPIGIIHAMPLDALFDDAHGIATVHAKKHRAS